MKKANEKQCTKGNFGPFFVSKIDGFLTTVSPNFNKNTCAKCAKHEEDAEKVATYNIPKNA